MTPNFLDPALIDVLKGLGGREGGTEPVPSGPTGTIQPGAIENAIGAIASAFGGPTSMRPNGLVPQGTYADSGFAPPARQQTGQDLISQAYGIPDAQQRKPAFRTADLAVLLPALFAGPQAGNILSGYAQGKAQKAQMDTQGDQAAVDRKRQGLLQQGQQMQGQEATAAKNAFEAQQAAAERDFRKGIADQENATRLQGIRADLERNKLDRDSREAAKRQANVNSALTRIASAKTLPEVQAAVAFHNANADEAQRLDDTAVAQIYQQKQRQWIDDASNQVQKDITSNLNAFGEIDDSTAKILNQRRKSLAASYGISVDDLPAVPTGQTIKAQHEAEYKRQFDKNLDFKNKSLKDSLAIRMADLALARQRYDYSVSHGNAMLGISQDNLDVAQQRLALSQYQAAQKGAKGAQQKALDQVNKQISGTETAIRSAFAAGRKTDALKDQLAKYQGQKAYLIGLLPEDAYNQAAAAVPLIPTISGPVQIRPLNPLPSGPIGGGLQLPPGWKIKSK